MKYINEVRKKFEKTLAFTKTDLRVFLKNKKISESYLKLLIHNLLKRKEIKRINKGVYSFQDDIMVVGFGFKPFYYGLQEALSLKGLWEQETNPVIITPRKVRTGIRTFDGSNYLVKRINRKMFFGFEMIKYNNFWVPVSDTEKTLIDLIYFSQPINKKTLREIKKKINKQKLREYLKKCSPQLRKKVIDHAKILNT